MTTMDERGHTTHVVQQGASPTTVGQRWQATCDRCGDIGQGERYEQDALTIAHRHQEVGGFG